MTPTAMRAIARRYRFQTSREFRQNPLPWLESVANGIGPARWPEGVPREHCKVVGDAIVEMTAREKAGVDAREAAVRLKAQWMAVRADRNTRLAAADWVMLPDCRATQECQRNFMGYRQRLRDLPGNTADPFSVTWPDEPAYEKTP